MALEHKNLYLKRDDLSGAIINNMRLFGGNKVRKLEIPLADAREHKATKIATMGCAGSNHALATAMYSKLLGLHTYLVLAPQHPSSIVQRNLLLDKYCDATIIPVENRIQRIEKTNELKQNFGDDLYVIPVGGSVPLGSVGYVNAVFEFKNQIQQNIIPEPDVIYVAMGSGGTAAGLILGARATGLKSVIRPIAVDTDDFQAILSILVPETNKLLHELDNNFPLFDWQNYQYGVVRDYIGQKYGVPTTESKHAAQLMQETENITLENTYTAKAFAAFIHDVDSADMKDKNVLFWNTFSIGDFADLAAQIDYRTLPPELHRYFN